MSSARHALAVSHRIACVCAEVVSSVACATKRLSFLVWRVLPSELQPAKGCVERCHRVKDKAMPDKAGSCVPCGRSDQLCCAKELCSQKETFCDKDTGRCSAAVTCGMTLHQACCPGNICHNNLECLTFLDPPDCIKHDDWHEQFILRLRLALDTQ